MEKYIEGRRLLLSLREEDCKMKNLEDENNILKGGRGTRKPKFKADIKGIAKEKERNIILPKE